MKRPLLFFRIALPELPLIGRADVLVLLGVVAFASMAVQMSLHAPATVTGPKIDLSPSALPWYTAFSLGRMAAAYVLSLTFTLLYGYYMARSRRARVLLLPLLDILQSIPILSFLPIVLLSLSALMPQAVAAEIASIVLIFTSQAWNMTFSWYQSLITIPNELDEASSVFRFNSWMRFRTVELPFAAIGLIWNSIMSWAGGWFFLMAAEIFSVGEKDFRLRGLGAYLQEAANQGDAAAIGWGIGTLVLVIVALDQLVWRPLLAWSERFKLDMVESEQPRTSWFYDLVSSSALITWLGQEIFKPMFDRMDMALVRRFPGCCRDEDDSAPVTSVLWVAGFIVLAGMLYFGSKAFFMLAQISLAQWIEIALSIGATLVRVLVALVLALAWTLPVGVAIGTNPRLSSLAQPIVQVTASIPATALFPVIVMFMLQAPGGLSTIAVLLMLLGTQWYLLFNIIAGASAIPQDLKYTASLLQLTRPRMWRTLFLPALFPYVITGAIAAGGGAWNASIVAEHVNYAGKSVDTVGIGSLIARATATADYPVLLASTLAMIFTVVLINRFVWRRMFRLAEERYRID